MATKNFLFCKISTYSVFNVKFTLKCNSLENPSLSCTLPLCWLKLPHSKLILAWYQTQKSSSLLSCGWLFEVIYWQHGKGRAQMSIKCPLNFFLPFQNFKRQESIISTIISFGKDSQKCEFLTYIWHLFSQTIIFQWM